MGETFCLHWLLPRQCRDFLASDMEPTALLPLRRKACWGYSSSWNIRRLRLGSNPRTWVPEASILTPWPPKPLLGGSKSAGKLHKAKHFKMSEAVPRVANSYTSVTTVEHIINDKKKYHKILRDLKCSFKPQETNVVFERIYKLSVFLEA
jgi:hypothetical protein